MSKEKSDEEWNVETDCSDVSLLDELD